MPKELDENVFEDEEFQEFIGAVHTIWGKTVARLEDDNVGSDAAYDNIANEDDEDMVSFNGNYAATDLNNSIDFVDYACDADNNHHS